MDIRHIRKEHFSLLIGLALFIIAGTASGGYYLGSQTGYEAGYEKGIRKEVESQYRSPVNNDPVTLNVDTDKVLAGLVQREEALPNQAFQASVNQVNRLMLTEVGNRYGLSDEEKQRVLRAYDTRSDDVISSYYKELKALKQARVSSDSQTFVSLETREVANDFSVILADRTCSLVAMVMGFSSMREGNKLVLNAPCTFIAKDLLEPLAQAMKNRGLVIDINKSQYKILEHTRSRIAELAVAEDQLREVLNQTFTRRMFKDTWAEFDSTATLAIRANGSIKAGFDLQDHYDVHVDHSAKVFYVTLPKAKVLSKEINFDILKSENGWFIDVTPERLNATFSNLRSQLAQKAVDQGLLKLAEDHAIDLVRVFYSPITSLPGSSYLVKVRFEG